MTHKLILLRALLLAAVITVAPFAAASAWAGDGGKSGGAGEGGGKSGGAGESGGKSGGAGESGGKSGGAGESGGKSGGAGETVKLKAGK